MCVRTLKRSKGEVGPGGPGGPGWPGTPYDTKTSLLSGVLT